MSYRCEILADSISPQGHRLTTFKITYPRIIHAEMCRHRILSRNTASSRAIPLEKMVKDVQENPFIPIAWQKDHKGMQGSEYLVDDGFIEGNWLRARDFAVRQAKELCQQYDVTKQLCNRLLEPFVWTTELVSGTEWENFFELRCPKYHYDLEDKYFKSKKDWLEYYKKTCIGDVNSDFKLKEEDWLQINKSQAEIHIQKIAEMMWDEINSSKPKILQWSEWHVPYGDNLNDLSENLVWDKAINSTGFIIESPLVNAKLKIATARAARISYTTLGDDPKIDYEADIKLHDRLLDSKHLSCFEHCARAMSDVEYYSFVKGEIPTYRDRGGIIFNQEFYPKELEITDRFGWCNNFKGFINYRYLIENK